jgi:hypothetical protein
MSLLQTCVSLVRKYGPTAKVVTTGVLNVVAPGSGALVELAGRAIDAASESAEQIARADWEQQVLARLGQSEAELARLAQLLEYLTGPLAAICDKAAAFADQPADLPEIVQRAIAANPSLSKVLHEIGNLKEQFGVFQADIRRLAERQDEAAGVYARMHRVADYFDELWQAGVRPQSSCGCCSSVRRWWPASSEARPRAWTRCCWSCVLRPRRRPACRFWRRRRRCGRLTTRQPSGRWTRRFG